MKTFNIILANVNALLAVLNIVLGLTFLSLGHWQQGTVNLLIGFFCVFCTYLGFSAAERD